MVQLLSCVDSKFTFLAVSIYDRNMFYSIVYRSSEKQKNACHGFNKSTKSKKKIICTVSALKK